MGFGRRPLANVIMQMLPENFGNLTSVIQLINTPKIEIKLFLFILTENQLIWDK